MKKNFVIKIPKNIIVMYSPKKKLLTLIGPLQIRSMFLEIKLNIDKTQKKIEITSIPFSNISNNKAKQMLSIRSTTTSLIKQLLLETCTTIYSKLKFVGVGYRAFGVEKFKNKLLMFKLGYSHPIFFKIPNTLKIVCFKFIKLFIFGNSYQKITQTSALIRSYKEPEPYKGKGILYESEKIILKEGKKV
jgi:large subunit ribosomal protein L6